METSFDNGVGQSGFQNIYYLLRRSFAKFFSFVTIRRLQHSEPNHYATLGLHGQCTPDQIRSAYRLLAKQFHPDVNRDCAEALARTQELNAAYEILSDPETRRAYDESRNRPKQRGAATRSSTAERNIKEEVHLRMEEFLRGTTMEVRVNDPANPDGPETYDLVVPPETAPGTRFKIPREGHFEGGFVTVQVRARADFRFKVRGSDLRCDLRISFQRAAQGGSEMVQGISGRVRVDIPRGVGRNEVIRISGEGLPKPRGGRGDLLVRIQYRPEVRILRPTTRRTG
ncbi:MAG: J domain-containing protein [Verrucomicrobia bacterium]|nr:J domain-containing protein [Verrucomicrobiota bacterium]